MKNYKFEYIDENNKRHTYWTYASSWEKAYVNYEKDNKDVKETIRSCKI